MFSNVLDYTICFWKLQLHQYGLHRSRVAVHYNLYCWAVGGGAVGADEGNLAVGGAGKFTTALLVSDTRITHTHLILLLTFLETILFIKQVQWRNWRTINYDTWSNDDHPQNWSQINDLSLTNKKIKSTNKPVLAILILKGPVPQLCLVHRIMHVSHDVIKIDGKIDIYVLKKIGFCSEQWCCGVLNKYYLTSRVHAVKFWLWTVELWRAELWRWKVPVADAPHLAGHFPTPCTIIIVIIIIIVNNAIFIFANITIIIV